MVCAGVGTVVDGLAHERGDTVRFEKVSASSPDARAYLERADLGGHGVEVFDARGKRVWHSTAHALDMDALKAAIESVAASPR